MQEESLFLVKKMSAMSEILILGYCFSISLKSGFGLVNMAKDSNT